MKVLLTVHQYFPYFAAGTEVLTRSVANELRKRGHEIRIFTGHPNNADLLEEERFDEYLHEGIHVYRFHHAHVPMGGQQSRVAADYDNKVAVTYFEKILASFKPDIVHFFHLNRLGSTLIPRTVQEGIACFMTPTDFWSICPLGQLTYGNGRLCSGPTKYAGNCVKHIANDRHGPVGYIAKKIPIAYIDLLSRLTQIGYLPRYPQSQEVAAVASRLDINISRLNQLSGLVVPTEFMTKLLIQYGIAPHLITQAAFGVDITTHEETSADSRPRHPFRIGFIGTHAPHKGCHILVEAFNALPREKAILKIYGKQEEFPEYSAELRKLSENNEAIKFCGIFHNSNIGRILADLDLLVVPSLWYENSPLILYSAQAARCPTLASDLPGISSVIKHEGNGLLFQAGNIEELKNALLRAIDEPELIKRLSNNCSPPKSTSTYVDELLKIWKGDDSFQELPTG